ncbi:viperin family antiviral radical SAM protein [Rubellimicrobium rubrum]|nr:viperin family antiviral radical SAM protein [Rubellimicrobium rubrum]
MSPLSPSTSPSSVPLADEADGAAFLSPMAGEEATAHTPAPIRISELTINWHINEACNFGCSYCYAKWAIDRSPFRRIWREVIDDLAQLPGRALDLRPQPVVADRIRLNFAGGEPFLMKDLEAAVARAAGAGLAPSFISNGSLITDRFIDETGPMISVAGFSFDSLSSETTARIGRAGRRGEQVGLDRLGPILDRFRAVSPTTILKINTVVCDENADEDLTDGLLRLAPHRWKMLRVIPGHGGVPISDERFAAFVQRHVRVPGAVVEDNADMHRSYLMMNPEGRFYQREGSGYVYGGNVLDKGALAALAGVEFDSLAYLGRY